MAVPHGKVCLSNLSALDEGGQTLYLLRSHRAIGAMSWGPSRQCISSWPGLSTAAAQDGPMSPVFKALSEDGALNAPLPFLWFNYKRLSDVNCIANHLKLSCFPLWCDLVQFHALCLASPMQRKGSTKAQKLSNKMTLLQGHSEITIKRFDPFQWKNCQQRCEQLCFAGSFWSIFDVHHFRKLWKHATPYCLCICSRGWHLAVQDSWQNGLQDCSVKGRRSSWQFAADCHWLLGASGYQKLTRKGAGWIASIQS